MVVVIPFLFSKRFAGIALWPIILLKSKASKEDAIFLNHERILLKQQIEMLIIPFYVWYVLEFLVRLFYYKNSQKAYLNISFEREAYKQQSNLNYLKNRKFWAFTKYI